MDAEPHDSSEALGARLTATARQAAQAAYAPYSGFPVGAALLGEDGRVYAGCNVENASYGLTICAERNALAAGIASGCRRFAALAIAAKRPVPPCGACCQVLAEFCPPEMPLWLAGPDGSPRRLTFREVFPQPFSL